MTTVAGAGRTLPRAAAVALRRPGLVWVGLALMVWLAATAWMRPLMLPDEGRYVGVAWEMLRSGDWLTPRLDGLPFFHKPPLFYWLTASAMGLFGPHEWAARAAPLLGAWLGGMALYLFLRRWAGPRRAGLALAVLAVQPLFLVGGQFANLDMLVAGCISATVLALADAVLRLERALPHHRSLALAAVMAALGVLAKGLIGAVLPVGVIVVWLLASGRWHRLSALLWWPGWLLFGALAAPWFVAMQMHHPGFLDYFFVVQHFKRFAAGGFNNVQPFWFYPAVLAGLSLPFLPWLLRAARAPATPPEPLRALMLSWAAVVVVFFSLPASKLVGYVLPAVPPLAALMADGLARARAGSAGRRRWAPALAFAAAALAGLGLVSVLALQPPHSGRELAAALARQHQQGEPVVTLAAYPYDLPFYARLAPPVYVLRDWADPAVRSRDDWRKELADAADFATPEARRALLAPAALPGLLCSSAVSWVITDTGAATTPPWLAGAEAAYRGRDATLWRLRRDSAASALGCARTPSSGSPGR